MARQTSSRMIGRGDELAELTVLLTDAAAGTAGVALLGGDAGAGKTRLLQELIAAAADRGFLTFTGSCAPVGDNGLPYLPVLDALRQVEELPEGRALLERTVRQRPPLGRLLPHLVLDPVPTDTDEGLVQGQLFEALHRVLLDLSAQAPVLLVFEDLHWADSATRDLLSFLARTLRAGRVAVVASYRTDDLHRRHPLRPLVAELSRLPQIRRVQLTALRRDQLAELVEALTGQPADARQVENLLHRSGGNPFFAEELLQSEGSRRDLPTNLADVLLDRVAQLPEPAVRVLTAVAVAAREVDESLLAEVVDRPDDEFDAGLRQALESGLLRNIRDGYTPRHALLQEAIYGDLLPGERGRWHARFAAALASRSGNRAELAHHLLGARRRAEALPVLLAAAAEAETVAASGEALRHLEQALDLLEDLGSGPDGIDRLDLLARAADAAFGAGEPRRAVALGRAAIEEADRTAGVARRAAARERQAQYILDIDAEEHEKAFVPAAEAAALLADQPESALNARVFATWARCLLWSDVQTAAALLEQATAVAERVGADHLAADAIVSRALLAQRGIIDDDPAALFGRALAKVGTSPAGWPVRIRALRFETSRKMDDGDLIGALAAADEGVALAREAGLVWAAYGLDLQLIRGWVLMAQGRWDEMLADAYRAMYAPSSAAGLLASQAVWVLVGRGDPACEQVAARLRSRRPDWFLDLQLKLAEMRWRVRQGRPEVTMALADSVRADLGPNGGYGSEYLVMLVEETEALALSAERARTGGDASAAASLAVQAASKIDEARRSIGTRVDMRYDRALLARIAAEIARAAGTDTDTDWAQFEQAAELAGQFPDVTLARSRRFGVRLAAGLRDETTAELGRAAVAGATALGATWLADQVLGSAQRARLPLTGTSRLESSVELMTAREAEVLALLATGRSNGEIAKVLFISAKTASVHVSHILAKLGAGSRTEAVALARARGLLSGSRQ